MNIKDILLMYLLIILVILTNFGGALLYQYYIYTFAEYFQFMLGLIGVAFTIMQLIIIGNFCYKAFQQHFKW